MSETQSWFRRPRYGPLHLMVLWVLTAGVMAVGAYWYVDYGMTVSVNRVQILKEAAFASPLPEVVMAPDVNPNPQGRTFRREYDLSMDYVTRYLPLWEKAFAPYKGKPGVHYLEIGAFEGGSVVWMLENILTGPTARITAIDVFDGPYKDKYFANIDRSGCADKVTTLTGFSQVILRGLPLDSFDIIYVDGSHVKSDVLEDAVLSWRLLRVGGLMVFDDYRIAEKGWDYNAARQGTELWCPKLAIDPFVQCFEHKCEVLHNGAQLIIRKIQE